jgi:hypothetical protein
MDRDVELDEEDDEDEGIQHLIEAEIAGEPITDAQIARCGYALEYGEIDCEWYDAQGVRWGWPGVTKKNVDAYYEANRRLRDRLTEINARKRAEQDARWAARCRARGVSTEPAPPKLCDALSHDAGRSRLVLCRGRRSRSR